MRKIEKYHLYVIYGIFLIITIPLACRINIWYDEAYTLNTTSKSIVYAYKQAINFEMQPPVYFILLSIWRMVNETIIWARMLSILCILLSIFLINKLLINKIEFKFIPLLFFTINPITIWAALEIRVYPLVILTSIAYLYFFDKYYIKYYNKLIYRIINIFSILIGIYIYYFFSFLVLGVLIYLIIDKRKLLINYIVDLVIPTIGIIITLGWIFRHIEILYIEEKIPDFTIIDFIRYSVFHINDVYLISLSSIGIEGYFAFVFRIIFLSLLVIIVITNKQKLSFYIRNIYIIISIIIFICFAGVRYTLGEFYVLLPHSTIIFIPLFMAFISVLLVNKYRMLIALFFMFLIIINTISLFNEYKNIYKRFELKALVNYINNVPNEKPVFFYTNDSYEVLSYYINDKNIIPLPYEIDYSKFDYYNWIIKDTTKLDSIIIENLNSLNQDIFLYVTDNRKFLLNRTANQDIVREYFINNYLLIDSFSIEPFSIYNLSKKNTRVDSYSKKSSSIFSN